MKRALLLLLVLSLSFSLISCANTNLTQEIDVKENIQEEIHGVEHIDEDGYYTTQDDVALYIYTYGKLPKNYITKKEAMELGWESKEGNLWDVTDKMSIGGDRFGNREGILPKAEGRQYYECDVNYVGGHRGAERIVYSNDGLVYYTKDHYKSFILLYGDE